LSEFVRVAYSERNECLRSSECQSADADNQIKSNQIIVGYSSITIFEVISKVAELKEKLGSKGL